MYVNVFALTELDEQQSYFDCNVCLFIDVI